MLSLAQLVIAIDVTVMSTALPSIQADLGVSTETGQWVLTSYALPFGALLLLGGRFSDYWGRKRAFLVGLVGFAVASAVGGLAPDTATLLAARALQGAFAALLVPAALSLINVMFTEPKERARALAAYNAVVLSGVALGLILGGVIAEYISWRWCLLVNPPVCALAFLFALPLLDESRMAGRPRYDVLGALLGTLSLAALVYGFARAGTDGWSDPITLASLIGAAVFGAVFVGVESRVDQPLLPLRLLANRTRSGALLAILLQFIGLFGIWLFLTYYLQGVAGHSPATSGLMLLPYAVAAVAIAALLEQPLGRMAPRVPIVLGLFGAMLVGVWLSFLESGWDYATHILPAIVFFGMCIVCTMIAVSGAVLDASGDDSGVCSALLNVAQQVGLALGASLLTTIAVRVTENAADGAPPTSDQVVDGWNAASLVAAGIDLIAIVAVVLLIRSRYRTRAPAAASHGGSEPPTVAELEPEILS